MVHRVHTLLHRANEEIDASIIGWSSVRPSLKSRKERKKSRITLSVVCFLTGKCTYADTQYSPDKYEVVCRRSFVRFATIIATTHKLVCARFPICRRSPEEATTTKITANHTKPRCIAALLLFFINKKTQKQNTIR